MDSNQTGSTAVLETTCDESPFSENGFGPKSGPIDADSDSVASLKAQALEDLQRAWKSLRRLEDLADIPAESKAAGLAVAFVDQAFAGLESGE